MLLQAFEPLSHHVDLVFWRSEIWKKTKTHAGISHGFYLEYFAGKHCAFALAIGDVRKYAQPIGPEEILAKFAAPQSSNYIRNTVGNW
jgi:predicted transcriptional regulator